ncbi:hypothetical protein P378_19915 [Desulforamulus profundi]|uniref:Uncharacterized protein n=1 Tax=Desulforamulus profundi TaxID=1383067 RepID=A0A2C6MBI7_9FIRM|nr:hypothetical protein P378_19915 [Desulforamulus profundi]
MHSVARKYQAVCRKIQSERREDTGGSRYRENG